MPAFAFDDAELQQLWPQIHAADQAVFPTAAALKSRLDQCAEQTRLLPANFDGNYEKLAADTLQAWRLYHQGNFKQAYELASGLGLAGLGVRIRSKGMHHSYLLKDKKDRAAAFKELWEELKQIQAEWQVEEASLYLGLVFASGRYAQEISIVKALSDGMAAYVRDNTQAALAVNPNHPEGLAFEGAFHSEIIGKAGAFIGNLTYGVSEKEAKAAFDKVLALAPYDQAIRLEVAQQYMYLGGKDNLLYARELLDTIATETPYDAVTALDRGRWESMSKKVDARLRRIRKKEKRSPWK